jgi:hypothetical protein
VTFAIVDGRGRLIVETQDRQRAERELAQPLASDLLCMPLRIEEREGTKWTTKNSSHRS